MIAAHNPPGPNFKLGPLGWGRPQIGEEPLTLIIAYPLAERRPE